ncbi:MAG: DUF2889 domain-containing protein [Actinomycetota bacterium]
MSDAACPSDSLCHVRTIRMEIHDLGDSRMRVTGSLDDERTGTAPGVLDLVVHGMRMSWDVRVDDLVIEAVDAWMEHQPHAECSDIAPAMQQLVGLPVARGFTREVLSRLGSIKGCAHMRHLALAMAQAAVQGVYAVARHQNTDLAVTENDDVSWLSLLSGTCHVWSEGGPGPRKLAAGWRPGKIEMPVPRYEDLFGE